ncbi:MAG: magnesium chelatase subunit D family protein [Anaerolineae bacterium]
MPVFPFSAVVGQQQIKEALLLNAIHPAVGGVLIRGDKGTAKSTLARGLADLLLPISVVPGCPYQCDPQNPFEECPHCQPLLERGPLESVKQVPRLVTLPTNATEDRVCGTLDLEKTLKTGRRHFEPGLLAEAHRGILYIDEVNLLDNHIVDVLLDAAAMGFNTVEREGVRMAHPSRFVLIGTMNPEEGDLRPQLLDRFGLCVEVEALSDVEARARVIRQRLTWEKDPLAFAEQNRAAQEALTTSVQAAQERLPQVGLTDAQLSQIAALCVQLGIRSHRADLVTARAAVALAAWDERTTVRDEDIQRAAEMALPHRVRRQPFDDKRLDPAQVSAAMQPPAEGGSASEEPGDASPSQDQVFDVGAGPPLSLPELGSSDGNGRGRVSRPNHSRRGRTVRTAEPHGDVKNSSDIALDATLRTAAPHQAGRQAESSTGKGAFDLRPEDLRVKVREQQTGITVLFVVDASGSMGAADRMRATKGACLSLLHDAYVHRYLVGLIAFRDQTAQVLLQPTGSVELAHQHLKDLPTGGRTPLGHGLAKALMLTAQIRRRDAQMGTLVVLLSDGRANVPYDPAHGETPLEEAVHLAGQLTAAGGSLLILDTEDDFLTLGLARALAERAGAGYVKLADIEAAAVERAVRAQLKGFKLS